MNNRRATLFSAMFLLCCPAWAEQAAAGTAANDLSSTIARLDGEVFDAFNHCAEPGQLEKHASYFDPAVEFYHDTGGVTWTREAMLANTRQYVCGHYVRELIPGTLKVYPIRDFGAISQGEHRFCGMASGKCEGLADFVMVWQLRDGRWTITRVLSYGHRSITASKPLR
ncbi:nuclear transport factor 2 family protein [[Pseudomonas] boreopolis]|uniref:nuclear transport factor 2 family protein n=1 Tax=Xanthomonas boreopolis TaxID=86183 RepID=UPI003D593D3D